MTGLGPPTPAATPPRPPQRVVRGDLVLRRWHRTDAPAMAAIVRANLDHLRPWMPWAAFEPLSPEDRQALLGRWARAWEAGDELNYGMFVQRTPIGGCGLMRRIGPGGLEIGYWVDKDHQGRGYATRATAALTDVAFGLAGVAYVEVHHDVANVRSGAVPRRLGFTVVGDEPREVLTPGESGTTRVWRMRRADWPAHRPPG